MIFSHASKERPCLICKGADWCSFGQRAMLCQRVESDKPFSKGGWWHFYDDKKSNQLFTPPLPKNVPKTNVGAIKATAVCGDELAKQLGVSLGSLKSLGVGWSNEYQSWLFPMRNGQNEIIGYNRRFKNGEKRIVQGTNAGLYIPQVEPFGIPYVCEGGSDTAALLDLGLFGIGRFNVNSGASFLKEFFKENAIHRYVICADNDGIKQLGNKTGRPGIVGAERLRKEIGLPAVIWMPPSPIKDVREFLKKGGTKQMIESEIKNKIWKRL